MLRKALFVIALTALACGSQDKASTGTAGGMGAVETETPPVSAVQPSGAAATPTLETTTCLDLVSVGKYAEAVEICQTAATQDPTNTDVATALAKAGAATAAQGVAGAASAAAGNAAAAVEGAASDAAKATGEAADSAAAAAKDAVGDDDEKAAD
jgi:hypothetical protein